MWLVVLMAAALAAPPLDVTVAAAPRPARPEHVPGPPRPAVAVRAIGVVVDGVRDPSWDEVPLAPALVPVREGGPAPTLPLQVALRAPDVVITTAVLPGVQQVLVLDPAGTEDGWWRLTLGEEAEAAWCTLADASLPMVWTVPARAVPCEPRAVEVAKGAVWEVALPVPALTDHARLGRVVSGDVQGTWAPSGHAMPWPAFGRLLQLPRLQGRVGRVPDVAAGVWQITARLLGDVPAGTWTWRQVFQGRVVDGGRVAVTGEGEVTWEVPLRALPDAHLVLQAPGEAWPARTLVAGLWAAEAQAWMASPLYDTHVVVGLELPAPLEERVVVTTMRGRVLGEAQVSLPAGGSTLTVRAGWRPGPVKVVLATVAAEGLVAWRAR